MAAQAWRERFQEASWRAQAHLDKCMRQLQARADDLSRGGAPRRSRSNTAVELILSPSLAVANPAAFAWLPDSSRPQTLPVEFTAADTEAYWRPGDASRIYQSLVSQATPRWRGYAHLRLANTLRRAGNESAARSALQRAAHLPNPPVGTPSQFAARFLLASDSQEEAARLYHDLASGQWVLEKTLYDFYESQLRRQAGTRIPAEVLALQHKRQAMARLLERVVAGERGWVIEGPVAAFVHRASRRHDAAILTPESQWNVWLDEGTRDIPRGVLVRMGTSPPPSANTVSLEGLGLPWVLWAEPRDPAALDVEQSWRRRQFIGIFGSLFGIIACGVLVGLHLLRRELRIAQLRSEFAAAISHEFRSPLTGIRQLSEMLLAGRAAGDEPRRRHYYELISREIDRLSRLVDNVLDFSSLESGKRQFRRDTIETAAWLRELAAIAARRREISLDVPKTLPDIEGDRDALSAAVLNLIDNAIKYSTDDSPVEIRADADREWVNLAVVDHGQGIPPAERPYIFDSYFRGKQSYSQRAGAGFGLTIVKRIADAHSARLSVESAPGTGSIFTISLRFKR
jgi:signal transduction histidine kinase